MMIPSKQSKTRSLGARAEVLADDLFAKQGYRPVESNARSAGVECDRLYYRPKSHLASQTSSDCFVFAEIKFRSSAAGDPLDTDALRRFFTGIQFSRQRNRFQRYSQRLKEKHPQALFFHVLVWINRQHTKGAPLEVRVFDLCSEQLFHW